MFAHGPGKHDAGGTKKRHASAAELERFSDGLADGLGISHEQAVTAMRALDRLGRDHGVDPDSRAFAALARGLGVTPQRLADALRTVKTSLADRGDGAAKDGKKAGAKDCGKAGRTSGGKDDGSGGGKDGRKGSGKDGSAPAVPASPGPYSS